MMSDRLVDRRSIWRVGVLTDGQQADTSRHDGGLLAVAVGAAQGFLWWLASALTCDEGCDDRSHLWRDNPDAWQWSALAWLGAGCFALCVAFAVSLAARRPRLSGTLLTAAFLVGIAPWILYGSV
jgi:hypothetical protein